MGHYVDTVVADMDTVVAPFSYRQTKMAYINNKTFKSLIISNFYFRQNLLSIFNILFSYENTALLDLIAEPYYLKTETS